jgi:hypothetical protein
MTKTPEELRKFLTKTFGEFKDFKDEFFKIKFGTLPPKAHPHPRTIAKIKKKEEWPYNFRELDDLYAVCYNCKNRGLFSGCNLCVKVVTTGCDGLKREANKEEIRQIEKANEIKWRNKK